MLRASLEHNWRSYLLAACAMCYLCILVFTSEVLRGYGDQAVDFSAKRSVPNSDVLVYSENRPALDVAKDISQLPSVREVYVDASRPVDLLFLEEHLVANMRTLPPASLRTQHLLSGSFPTSPNQVAISYHVAEQLNVTVGQSITVLEDRLAQKLNITGIYARSPLRDQLETGLEILSTIPPADDYLAYQTGDSMTGGIEVRRAPGYSRSQLLQEVLAVPDTLAITNAERLTNEVKYESSAVRQVLAPRLWVIATGGFTALCLIVFGFIWAGQTRKDDVRINHAHGRATARIAGIFIRESLILWGISCAVGLLCGYAITAVIMANFASSPAAFFLPPPLHGTLGAVILALCATFACAILGGGISCYVAHSTAIRSVAVKAFTVVVGGGILGALLLHISIEMPLFGYPGCSVQTLAIHAVGYFALTIFAFLLAIVLHRIFTRFILTDTRITLLSRTRQSALQALCLWVFLILIAAITAAQTSSAGMRSPISNDSYDIAVHATVDSGLSAGQTTALNTWTGASRRLALAELDGATNSETNEALGPIYIVDPHQAAEFFGVDPDDLSGTILFPAEDSPATAEKMPITFTLHNIGYHVNLSVRNARVPIPLVSRESLMADIPISEYWLTLTGSARHNIAESYLDLNTVLHSVSLNAGDHTNSESEHSFDISLAQPLAAEHIDMGHVFGTAHIMWCVIFVSTAFFAIRSALGYAAQVRILRSHGLSVERIGVMHIIHSALVLITFLIAGVALGIAGTFVAVYLPGFDARMPFHIPVKELAMTMALISGGYLLVSIVHVLSWTTRVRNHMTWRYVGENHSFTSLPGS
ncbi:ABC transporter permease [Trueperella sp. LYQ141]|uniref:ABC transporter permease n=1 Tax=Trueperella sp. LYQ141 TaxID=3391058 RepID=UPI003982DC77